MKSTKILAIISMLSISIYSFGITWPFGSGGTIKNDLTVENPEKFAKGTLIKKYFDSVSKFYDKVEKDLGKKNFDRDIKNLKVIENYLKTLQNVSDRMRRISARLRHESGAGYYGYIQRSYFSNLDRWTSKTTDPFNLLNKKYPNFLYRYLAWNIFEGKKSADELRELPAQKLEQEILKVADKVGNTKQQYAMLLREIRSFFSDELAKEEYDAFVDGREALDRLVISNNAEHKSLDLLSDKLLGRYIKIKTRLLTDQNSLKDLQQKKA